MPVKIIIDDNKGLYQQYDASSGGAVGIKQSRASSGSADGTGVITSGAITIPANSLITDYHVIITSAVTVSAADDIGIKFGTAASDASKMALVATSMCASDDAITTLPVGFGNSTDANISASLEVFDLDEDDVIDDINTTLVAAAGQQKIGDTDVVLYGKMVADAEDFSAGTVQFVIEFITFS